MKSAVAEVAEQVRKPGRPRSEQAEQAIIDATLELFGERGVEGVCVEAVAARAGVGKATIYRRWSSKEDLLIAALGSLKSPLPEPRGESVRDDLVLLLAAMIRDASDPRYMRQFAMLHGEASQYPRVLARYTETVVEPRREVIRSVLRRGIATGELRADLDIEIAMLSLTGAVISRGKHDPCPPAPEFAPKIVHELMHGFAPR
ncbi:MAG TPA: TetR/AcrR family transcriptional regulator [Streptosporangiaceae bacterium]|nr:TetR/AcrR family transcriptional regulator [Streptosporangiaceae bacterium]